MNSTTKPIVYATSYDRAACTTGVAHLGFGAFHRAHQAVYIDDYMEATGDLNWGIVAVNLRAAEAASFAEFASDTDGYVLKSVAPDGETSLRKIRSHLKFVDWSKDPTAAEAVLADQAIQIVTITVTESGYYTDTSGFLDPSHPVILAESKGSDKQSVYAYLSAGLAARASAGGGPITIMCCDNIRQNGKKLAANMKSYLAMTGQDALSEWVKANVTFPCSMVDRITPRTTEATCREIGALVGPQDVPPVMAEAFLQWVVEDRFAGPVPDLSQVGVTITQDVDPYEEAKIRILNGGHTCLTYLAALRGIKTFDQAMLTPDLYDHFWQYETKEVLPGLTLDLPFDKHAYLGDIAARFKNVAIADTVSRICADGMAKFPIFIRPTLEGCLEQGIMPHAGIRSIASWYVFAKHSDAGKIPFAYLEPAWETLKPMLTEKGRDTFVQSHTLWGDLPGRFPEFASALKKSLLEMEEQWPI